MIDPMQQQNPADAPNHPWQLSKKPHEWQAVLAQAHHDLQMDHTDESALDAIDRANEALSVYDQASAEGGVNRLKSSFGGAVGLGESVFNLGKSIWNAPGTLYREVVKLKHDPETSLRDLNETVENAGNAVTGFLNHPVRTLEEATPRDIGRNVGNIGLALAPFAKLSTAGSGRLISPLAEGVQGPLDAPTTAVTNAPSLGGQVGRGVARVGKSIARIPSSVADLTENLVNKPKITNQMNIAKAMSAQEQAELAASRRTGVNITNEQILPERIQQAQSRSGILGKQLERQTPLNEAAQQRIALLEQQIERGGPTLENVQLRNELLKLKLQQIADNAANARTGGMGDLGSVINEEDASGLFGNSSPQPSPPVTPPKTPTPMSSPAEEASLQRLREALRPGGTPIPDELFEQPKAMRQTPQTGSLPAFETHGPGGQSLPLPSPKRLLGPREPGDLHEMFPDGIDGIGAQTHGIPLGSPLKNPLADYLRQVIETLNKGSY